MTASPRFRTVGRAGGACHLGPAGASNSRKRRQGAAHRFGARGVGFVHAREIIPIDVVHLRFEQNVRMPGTTKDPVSFRARPGSGDRTPSPRFAILRNSPRLSPRELPARIHRRCWPQPRWAPGTRCSRRRSRWPSYSTGLNSPGNAQLARMATSSGPLCKDVGCAGVQIRGHNRGRNGQFLDLAGMEPFPYELADAILPLRARPRGQLDESGGSRARGPVVQVRKVRWTEIPSA